MTKADHGKNLWKAIRNKPTKKCLKYAKSRNLFGDVFDHKDVGANEDGICLRVRNPKTASVLGYHQIYITKEGRKYTTVKRSFGKIQGSVSVIQGSTKSTHVNLCEGFEDACSLKRFGAKGAICSTNGTAGLRSYAPGDKVKSVHIFPDNDEAGRSAAASLAKRLRDEGIVANLCEIPEGKDLNEYLAFLLKQGSDLSKLNFPSKVKNEPLPDWCDNKPVFCGQSFAELAANAKEKTNYLIKGRIPEGLTILAGRPKTGKSLLAIELAVATAYGNRRVLGKSLCASGSVLLLALEDNDKRVTRRLSQCGREIPWDRDKKIRIWCASTEPSFPELDKGGLSIIEGWANSVDNPKLVIIDVIERVKPAAKRGESEYKSIYTSLQGLHKLANEKGLFVIAITHTRKSSGKDTDPFESILGSTALEGVADSTLVFQSSMDGTVLHGRGRDLRRFSRAVRLVKGKWKVLGKPAEIGLTDSQLKILNLLKSKHQSVVRPKAIVQATRLELTNINKALSALGKKGLVEKIGRGKYRYRKS